MNTNLKVRLCPNLFTILCSYPHCEFCPILITIQSLHKSTNSISSANRCMNSKFSMEKSGPTMTTNLFAFALNCSQFGKDFPPTQHSHPLSDLVVLAYLVPQALPLPSQAFHRVGHRSMIHISAVTGTETGKGKLEIEIVSSSVTENEKCAKEIVKRTVSVPQITEIPSGSKWIESGSGTVGIGNVTTE